MKSWLKEFPTSYGFLHIAGYNYLIQYLADRVRLFDFLLCAVKSLRTIGRKVGSRSSDVVALQTEMWFIFIHVVPVYYVTLYVFC